MPVKAVTIRHTQRHSGLYRNRATDARGYKICRLRLQRRAGSAEPAGGDQTGQGAHKTHCFFVAEDDAGQLAGALIGGVERHFFSDLLVASVIHYDVLPDRRMSGAGLKLLAAFRKWAENREVFELSVGINSGVELEKMDRFLKRLGFRQTGGNYALSLKTESNYEVR